MHWQFTKLDSSTVLYVPVVFHVVHNANRGFVTDDQIIEQVKVINEDYSGSNSDKSSLIDSFKALSGNANIQFFLPIENGTLAITRTQTSHGPFFNDDLHSATTGGADPWDASVYLNIWIADLAGGILGYAAVPGSQSNGAGVAIHFENFGRWGNAKAPYHLGRTATHEIGHWLGLSHPWGDGDCVENDGLDDTPAQDRPADNCDLSFESCGSLAIAQNFMNTAPDPCLVMFTHDQVDRMRETLINKRPGNYTIQPPLITLIEMDKSEVIEIFPNPSRGRVLTISMSSKLELLGAFDMAGKEVRSQCEEATGKVDLFDAPAGLYVLIFSDHVRSYQRKVILIN